MNFERLLKVTRKQLRHMAKVAVYFAQETRSGEIKIGFSTQVPNRLGLLGYERLGDIVLLGWIPGGPKVEREMHAKFKEFSLGHEWFEPAPELLDFIKTSTRHDEPVRVISKYGRITDWGFDALVADERNFLAQIKQESESSKARSIA